MKYTDPTGERCFRWCETSYYIWQKAMQIVLQEQWVVYNQAMASTWQLNEMIHAIYSSGSYAGGDTGGGCGGPGCAMGSGGPSEPAENGHGDGRYSEEFINKSKELGITPGKPIPNNLHTDAFLKDFQEAFYPKAPMEHIKKFSVENVDKEYYFHNDDMLGGITLPLSNHGMLTGNSYVYLNEDYVFKSPENLFYAMGHEFVHVSQFATLNGVERDIMSDPDFIMTLEYHANEWGLSVGRGINKAYDSFETEMIGCYSNRYHLNYTYFKWTNNLIHLYNWPNP